MCCIAQFPCDSTVFFLWFYTTTAYQLLLVINYLINCIVDWNCLQTCICVTFHGGYFAAVSYDILPVSCHLAVLSVKKMSVYTGRASKCRECFNVAAMERNSMSLRSTWRLHCSMHQLTGLLLLALKNISSQQEMFYFIIIITSHCYILLKCLSVNHGCHEELSTYMWQNYWTWVTTEQNPWVNLSPHEGFLP